MQKSVYLLEPVSNETADKLKELTLTSVILDNEVVSSDSVNKLKEVSPELKVFAEVPVFYGKEQIDRYPDAIPVNADGEKNDISENFYLCPTHEKVREEVLNKIKEFTNLGVDGIWLNFIRYATKWDTVEPKLLDTCYCERCLAKFEEHIGEKLVYKNFEELYLLIDGSYYFEWLEFKSDQIVSFIKEAPTINSELGAFIVPWMDKDYGAGIKRIVAQDFDKMSQYVKTFTPMLYHKPLGKDASWVKDMADYCWEAGLNFLPIVQSEPEEFKEVLNYATSGVSKGVCIYYFEDLYKNKPQLFDIVKSAFN